MMIYDGTICTYDSMNALNAGHRENKSRLALKKDI